MDLVPVGLLADTFETFAPMTREEAVRRAKLAADTLAATQSRSNRLQLGLALRSLELPPLTALAGGGWHRFSRASLADRERVLLAWSQSRNPQRRTAFQAWKRLALFLAYADPGPDPLRPANAAWDRIGYRPPEPPPVPARHGVVPVPIEESGDGDVVVIGSGAGGGVVAARLAAAGMDVVVLEAGGGGPPPVLEAEAWRDRYLDRGTTATSDLSVTILAGATLACPRPPSRGTASRMRPSSWNERATGRRSSGSSASRARGACVAAPAGGRSSTTDFTRPMRPPPGERWRR